MIKPLKIGTRGSPLALAQTRLFAAMLREKHPQLQDDAAIEIVTIKTSGDMSQEANTPLSEIGGKGLFTKEIEDALIDGSIDCAVHSMKDMPTALPDGLEIACLLPREDERDAFFSPKANHIDDLPHGAVVGTSSLRRQAMVLARRPDLKVVTFRGNVGTRLQKLQDGIVDATLLAVAGLNRLGKQDLIQTIIEPAIMLPAVAQGAIGIETRIGDTATRALIDAVHCPVTALRCAAERGFLLEMDGSCRMPLAALMSAPDDNGYAQFDAWIADTDGKNVKTFSGKTQLTTIDDAKAFGMQAARHIKEKT